MTSSNDNSSQFDIESNSPADDNEQVLVPSIRDSYRPRQSALPDPSPSTTIGIIHNEDRSTCSATIDTMVSAQTMTSANRREIDDLFDNLLDNKSVDRADCDGESVESNDGESTTMSSILPNDGASHIYAPPMEIIPEACSEQESGTSRYGSDRDSRIGARRGRISSPDKRNISGCHGSDSGLSPRDCGDRPEEVYIETFSNQNIDDTMSEYSSSTSHRYRTSGSMTRRQGTNSGVSSSGSSVTTNNGVSNILESMGLGPWEEDGGKGLNKNSISSLDSLLSGSQLGGNNDAALKKTRRDRKQRMIHLRAGMIMIFLVSLSFFAVQLSAVAQHDVYLRQDVRDHEAAYEDTLRDHFQYGKSGVLRGVPKIPRTLHEFANPVHASNRKGSETQRKTTTADIVTTVDVSESNVIEKVAPNTMTDTIVVDVAKTPAAQTTMADLKNEKLNEKIETNPNVDMASVDIPKSNPIEIEETPIASTDAVVEGVALKPSALNSSMVGNALEVKQEEPKTVVHGPVDSLPSIGNDKLAMGGQPQAEEINIISNEMKTLVADGTTNVLLLDGYTTISDIQTPDIEHKDVPLFWDIPQGGAEKIKEVLKSCMQSVIASEVGSISDQYTSETGLSTFKILGREFVNVNMYSKAGIEHARSLGLVQSGMADVIISPLFHDAITLFDANHHGRAFTMLRHPVERATSTYHDRKRANHPNISRMTIAQYAISPYIENNWMVRYLTGKVEGNIDKEDLALAKEILRTKFIVGLADRKEESMERVQNYFSFQYDPTVSQTCTKDILTSVNLYSDYVVKDGTPIWSLVEWQNRFDMELYLYGQDLFSSQGEQFFNEIS